ncbi:MAG: flavin reductase family protein [Dehalococcoidia bacterium]|nr:flavin reductase family protein [Dehalococcoidia bacterium]
MKLDTSKMGRIELHDLVGTAISPLPVVFISTVGKDGTYNAAPFAFASPVCSRPPIICISIGHRGGERKHTLKNIEFSHDFVINVVDEAILSRAVQCSADYPYGVDEMKENGLTAVKSDLVKAPRIAEAKVNLECKLVQIVDILEDYKDGIGLRGLVMGEVLMAHVSDDVATPEGGIDPRRLKAVGRIASGVYIRGWETFELKARRV